MADGQQKQLAACEYKAGKTLGKGSYGVVKEAIKISTSEKFAMKVISKSLMRGKEAMVLNEINVLKKASQGHKNIVTLVDYFESPNNLYLIMELCTGGELFDRICEKGSYYEEDTVEIVRIVLDAIAFLHSHNIVHRDIKPENLIFRNPDSSSDLMIADFGLSRIMSDDIADGNALFTTCGTPGYMVNFRFLTIGSWLAGYLPFPSDNHAIEVDAITNAKYDFESKYWKDISPTAKDFISKLLVVEPEKRLTAQQALAHPWFTANAPKQDLLPNVSSGFNARKMFKKAFNVVKTVNKLSHSNLHKADTSSNLSLLAGSATSLAEDL